MEKECHEVLKSHKEWNDHHDERLERHRDDLNRCLSAIKRLERHQERLELKVAEQEKTIDALEGVVENQQVVITRFRSCECTKGVGWVDWN